MIDSGLTTEHNKTTKQVEKVNHMSMQKSNKITSIVQLKFKIQIIIFWTKSVFKEVQVNIWVIKELVLLEQVNYSGHMLFVNQNERKNMNQIYFLY